MPKLNQLITVAVIATATAMFYASATAQPSGPGTMGAGRDMMGPGMMMGPGFMGRGGFGRTCSPAAAGFHGWRIDRIEQIIKPTEAQRAKFDDLQAASDKASEALRLACPTEVPTTAAGRMEFMERRMEAMLQSVKTVRPAFEAFYATLSDEQKARLDSPSDRGRFWRHLW
ncbi:Spy/CpxP family protein refolding chaperone [Bradyrhizobium japonicum]|uniref:Spy/CpxP family protein refolding chaperone n=1 Tax=Bradyrhizobium japonicum TaxID=375 RepID=UPI001BA91AA5|nr:Spy/CpxP family protein refolding chaperone [Bradyrhizobium japonicum]MBR0914594.1 Spy/CpxP family protein refolding chaperone [Bradyrhizobium japonicum]